MSLSGLFPFYGPIGVGPYNVSLTFPGKQSDISKSIGVTSSTNFLLPNIDYIQNFVNGNLGIADTAAKEVLFKNINKKGLDESTIKTFASLNAVDLGELDKYKIDGTIKIPKNKIPVPDLNPFKDLEKTIFKSLFETQKPYIEMIKIMTETLVKVEDVVARVMPLVSISPLTTKSRKPGINGGSGNNPKALGYKSSGIPDLESSLKELDKQAKRGGSNKNENLDSNPNNEYKVISIAYSTGKFDPSVKYTYKYIKLDSDDNKDSSLKLDDGIDPSHKYKPKNIIIGIYDESGTAYNPNDNKMNWVKKTKKWVFNSDEYTWGNFSEPYYIWTNGLFEKESKESPGKIWSKKTYKKDDKNIITKENAIEGDPIISRFEASDISVYQSYFNDIINYNINKSSDLTDSEKLEYSKTIKDSLNISSHIENLTNYGQLMSSVYNTDIPEQLRSVLKPKLIKVNESIKDDKISAYNKSIGRSPGLIWIDPESDYELKIIKVVVSKKYDNNDLLIDKPFSNKSYEMGTKETPMILDTINRKQDGGLDNDVFYIIEGVLIDDNNQSKNTNNSNNNSSEWYRLPHAVGVFKVFISLLIDIFGKLFPTINKLITLFKNPAKFVTDIIIEKVGENFVQLSPDAFKTFKKVSDIKKPDIRKINEYKDLAVKYKNDIPKYKEYVSNYKQELSNYKDYVLEVKDYFKESELSKWISVDDKGKPISVMDGQALIPFSLFGIESKFGIELKTPNIIEDKVPLKLIFEYNKNSNIKKEDLQKSNVPFKAESLSDKNINDAINSLKYDNSGYQVKNIKYSTGTYIKGVQYRYFYVTEDVNKTLSDVEDLEKVGEYDKALDRVNNGLDKNPDSEILKDKKKSLLAILKEFNENPLFKMLLGITVIPIKIIAGIVTKIMDFFKSFTNPTTLPTKITEFLSFKWIMEFFAPNELLKLIGINFNPSKLVEWKNKIESGKDKIPDSMDIADLTQYLNIEFCSKLPTYNAGMLRKYPDLPKKSSFSIMCLIEKIVNGIIDFIWSLIGLEALIKAPHITLCKDNKLVDTLDSNDVKAVLNNDKPDLSKTDLLYDITLPDGRVVKGLDQSALDSFMKDNQDINYDMNF